jgi:hypothetical protein
MMPAMKGGMSRTLQFHGGRSPSMGPKVAITSWY